MAIYILSGIIVILLGIIIRRAKGERQFLDIQTRLREKEIALNEQIDKRVRENEIKAQKEIITIREEVTKQKEQLKNYKTTELGTIKSELALFRETELNKIREEILRLDMAEKVLLEARVNEYRELTEQQIDEFNCSIAALQDTLNELKTKRDNTLAIIREEEKIKNEVDYYRLVLKQEDIEDIEQLRLVEKRLNNKDILRKLIYKTFIETPMNQLFARVGIKDISGIYKITNLKNNMVYIGQSTNVKNRVKSHIQASLGISTIAHQLVHDAMQEYGLENFTFQLIEECPKDKLNVREKYWINYYESNNFGYNRTAGG